ncbi:MAG: rhomboid family intramembrane serine protease, partial [Chthoniobacteraceae bacterium]
MMPEDEPSAPLAAIGRYRRLKAARERGLVVAAMELPHWIERENGEWVLFVEVPARDVAAAAVAEFEEEERTRPRAQRPEPLVIPKFALLATLAAMVIFYRLQIAAPPALIERGVAADVRILHGEWWRTISALTLHGGTEHLVSNIGLAVFSFAFVFSRFGTGVGLLGTVLGGALGNLLNAFAHASRPHESIGSSTAIFASLGLLAGGELAARLMHRSAHTGWRLLVPIGAGLAFLALYGGGGYNRDGTPNMDAGNVDVMAHLFGLAAGIFLGAIFFAAGLRRGASRRAQVLCGIGAVGALFAAWLAAGSHLQPRTEGRGHVFPNAIGECRAKSARVLSRLCENSGVDFARGAGAGRGGAAGSLRGVVGSAAGDALASTQSSRQPGSSWTSQRSGPRRKLTAVFLRSTPHPPRSKN